MNVKFRRTKSKSRQAGQAILEYIIIGLLLTIAAGALFRIAFSSELSAKVSSEGSNLRLYETKIRAMFPSRTNYTGLSTAMLISSGSFKSSMLNASGSAFVNQWDGNVTMTNTGLSGYTITSTTIPSSACIELVNGYGDIFREVTVGGTVVKAATDPIPVAATVVSACTSSPFVDIIFAGR